MHTCAFRQNIILQRVWGTDPPRTRTWNLRLRGPTPYPLGQQAFAYVFRSVCIYILMHFCCWSRQADRTWTDRRTGKHQQHTKPMQTRIGAFGLSYFRWYCLCTASCGSNPTADTEILVIHFISFVFSECRKLKILGQAAPNRPSLAGRRLNHSAKASVVRVQCSRAHLR